MANVPREVIEFRQEKEYEYWKNQGIVKPKKIKEKLKQEWNIEVSEKTVNLDLHDLEDKGKIKIITTEEKTEKRREIVKELYGEKGLTGEKLRQETNKRLEEAFAIPFSFSMTMIEKDIKFLKDEDEVTEEAKKQTMKETFLETIEEDLKRVEELTKDGKTIKQIADIVGIYIDTVKRYRRILKEKRRLTGEEKPRRQATIKKEKRMKMANRLLNDKKMTEIKVAEEIDVSIKRIAKYKKEQQEKEFLEWSESIIKTYDNFYGQPKSMEKFEEYIKICKERDEQGKISENDLTPIKCVAMATERYENIAFYIKLCIRFNRIEEALKFANSYVNHEDFSEQEKEKMKKARLECQRLYQSMNIIRENRNIDDAIVMKTTGLSKVEVLILKKKVSQQYEQLTTRENEENDDGEEPQI